MPKKVQLRLHGCLAVKWSVFFSWKTQFQTCINFHYNCLPDLPLIIEATLGQTITIEMICLYSSNQAILPFGDSTKGHSFQHREEQCPRGHLLYEDPEESGAGI